MPASLDTHQQKSSRTCRHSRVMLHSRCSALTLLPHPLTRWLQVSIGSSRQSISAYGAWHDDCRHFVLPCIWIFESLVELILWAPVCLVVRMYSSLWLCSCSFCFTLVSYFC